MILVAFLVPVAVVALTLFGLVAFLASAFLNPTGAWNGWVIGAIDHIAAFFPSTPQEYTLAGIAGSIADVLPFGTGIIFEIFQSFLALGGLMVIIKIYKLIPFKAT